MEMKNFVVTSSALANGVDCNIASLTVMDEFGSFMAAVDVTFKIDGNALFSNGYQSITCKSSALGQVQAAFTDNVAQAVVVTAYVTAYPGERLSQICQFVGNGSVGKANVVRTLLAVDDSRASGDEYNRIVAQTFNNDTPVADTFISAVLSNGARFLGGSSDVTIPTDGSGMASFNFSNTRPGKTTLTVFLKDNISVFAQCDSNFISAVPELVLSLAVLSNNAVANGGAANIVQATVLNKSDNSPVSGVFVNFSCSGSATFVDGGVSVTDEYGQAFATLVDNVKESVLVTAIAGGLKANASVNFEAALSTLKVGRIFNANQSFDSTAGPTVAWTGATFTMEATGGTGRYNWQVTNGSEILSVTSQGGRTAKLRFVSKNTSQAERAYNVVLSDGLTSITFTIVIDKFFSKFGHWQLYGKYSDNYPEVKDLLKLYGEWGNMRSYDGWLDNCRATHYWTSDQSKHFAYSVNMTNGKVDKITYVWKCGYAG